MTETAAHGAVGRVHIRWMIRRDISEVLAIEHARFAYPWNEEAFLHQLRQRNCIGMVAEHQERIVGFMIYDLHKGSLDLISLAVHPEFSRQGIGRQMIAKLRGKLSAHRRTRLDALVRETSLDTQRFFAAMGFRATEVLREHYEDSGEDAYRFQYHFEPATAEVDRRATVPVDDCDCSEDGPE